MEWCSTKWEDKRAAGGCIDDTIQRRALEGKLDIIGDKVSSCRKDDGWNSAEG